MTKEEFGKFLEQKVRATKEAKPIDWESKKRDWLRNLAGFYEKIEEYLAPYRQSGMLQLERSSVSLTEEHIGTYQADSMTIFIGPDKVKLLPIGTLIIAGRGRVDMIGPVGSVKFILTAKDSQRVEISFKEVAEEGAAEHAPEPERGVPEEVVWKIQTSPPKIRFIELTSETFFSALMEVVNG